MIVPLQTVNSFPNQPFPLHAADEPTLRSDPNFAHGNRIGMSIGSVCQHLQRKCPQTWRSCIGRPCSRRQELSLFLLPKNVVPVVLVGFGYWLLTLAHTLFLWRSVRFVFSLGRGFRLGFDNLVLGDRFFRRSVFGLIN